MEGLDLTKPGCSGCQTIAPDVPHNEPCPSIEGKGRLNRIERRPMGTSLAEGEVARHEQSRGEVLCRLLVSPLSALCNLEYAPEGVEDDIRAHFADTRPIRAVYIPCVLAKEPDGS